MSTPDIERDYQGFSGKRSIRIIGKNDHFFMSRGYYEGKGSDSKLLVIWRFNQEGRLDNLHYSYLNGEGDRSLIEVDGYHLRKTEKNWEQKGAYGYKMPINVSLINGVDESQLEGTYRHILQKGHNILTFLLGNLGSHKIKDKKGKRSLNDILECGQVLKMIRNTALLKASVKILESSMSDNPIARLGIDYQYNNRLIN